MTELPADGSGPVILVIDDDDDVRGALEALLSHEGFVVEAAANGGDALTLLDSRSPDAIVLDWMLPKVDGAAFMHELRHIRGVATPVLVITGGFAGRTEALAAGADDHLAKPFDLDDLIRRVRRLTSAPV